MFSRIREQQERLREQEQLAQAKIDQEKAAKASQLEREIAAAKRSKDASKNPEKGNGCHFRFAFVFFFGS